MADLKGITIFANPQMARMLGTSPDNMVGRSVFDYVFPQDRGKVRRHFAGFLEEPGGKRVQERLRCTDGAELWTLVAASVFLDGARRPAGFLGMFADITERKLAEDRMRLARDSLEARVRERTAEVLASHQALIESEEKYRRLFETISDAAFVFDAGTRRFVEVNEAAERLYGYSREEFLKLTHRAITAEPEDSEASIRLTLAGAAPRIPLRYHKKKDGTVFPVEISASTFTFKGRPIVCGVIRDISARKQAEEEVRRHEEELADFFAQSPLGLLWTAPDGRVLRVNQAQLDLLGRTGDEVLGQNIAGWIVGAQAAGDLLGRLGKGETVQNFRARFRHKDGTLRHVLIDANGYWENERLAHLRWFARDISRHVELEQEILSTSEREKRRLGQDLHDDLCQQLVGIEFLSERLATNTSAGRSAQRRQAKEIAQMVRVSLTQARELARGLFPVALEVGGLNQALEELAARTRKLFRCDCRFERCGASPVPDHSVAIHLYRIAQEAVGNAVKHGRARRIDIGLESKEDMIILRVRDDGRGIPRERRVRMGMGLQIMRYRAEVIGGALNVHREPGGGTSVVCALSEALQARRGRQAL